MHVVDFVLEVDELLDDALHAWVEAILVSCWLLDHCLALTIVVVDLAS